MTPMAWATAVGKLSQSSGMAMAAWGVASVMPSTLAAA